MAQFIPSSQAPSVAAPRVEIQPLMKQVYMWMTLGLLTTAGVAAVISSIEPIRNIVVNPVVMIIAIVVQLGLVFGLSFGIQRFSAATATMMFFIYAAAMGFTLSIVLMVFSGASIVMAAATTAVLFGVMTMIGLTTQMDLTRFSTILFAGLIAIIVGSVVNIFLGSSMLYWIITYAGVIIFTGLIAYDTQKIKQMASDPAIEAEGPELLQKIAIMGALALYLDLINLFFFLLRIFGAGDE